MAFHESFGGRRAYDEGLPEASPYEGLERHVPPSEEKEYHPLPNQLPPENVHLMHPTSPGHDTDKSHASWHATQSEQNHPPSQGKRASWKRKRLWIPLAILLLIGAIVGGIVGGLSTRKSSSSVSDKEDSKASPDSTAASPSKSTSTASPSNPAQPSSKPLNSSLASVAWSDHGNLRYRRLYYQDDVGTIKESAWNSSADRWYLSQENIAQAKSNTPIAAAVAGNLTWSFTDHQNCKNNNCGMQTVLLAYQDSNNRIWIANATGSSPVLTRLEADPSPGTAITFQSVWHSTGSPGLRLYYVKGATDLIIVNHEVSEYEAKRLGDRAGNWTVKENNPVGSVSRGGSLASFTSGDDSSGDPLFYYTLSSGPQGIKTVYYSAGKGWRTDTPDVMKNVQPYSSVAANADRHVYAFEGGVVKEFVMSTDGLTWSLVGDVPTKP
ncbi:MAG: hypothetical protein Q9182_002290 [Xanthomendoza sp. 2 TL-2023]